MNRVELLDLKEWFPLPCLMEHLGLSQYAKPSCRSPLRQDQNASWGIYEHRGLWRWKDFGTGDGGDEVDFLARHLRLDATRYFPLLINVYESMALEFRPVAAPLAIATHEQKTPPDRTGYGSGSPEQLQKLSTLRTISVEALKWAQNRGVLVFGTFSNQEVFGVTDLSGRVVEVRRLDGSDFPAFGELGERKSHALRGSQKSWPVGINESLAHHNIALVEGVPDFLAAHDFILQEQGEEANVRVVPVAMLAASVRIAEEALQFFKNKQTFIYPHADEAGITAAGRWKLQIESVGGKVLVFDMTRVNGLSGGKVKDLNDLLKHSDPELLRQNPSLKEIMPR